MTPEAVKLAVHPSQLLNRHLLPDRQGGHHPGDRRRTLRGDGQHRIVRPSPSVAVPGRTSAGPPTPVRHPAPEEPCPGGAIR